MIAGHKFEVQESQDHDLTLNILGVNFLSEKNTRV